MIINCLVNDRDGRSPEQAKLRAQTLQSLASTCRMFQILCEEHLYTHPRSQRLSTNSNPQWLFLFCLTIEPRRAHHIRSLTFQPRPENFRYGVWVSTLELCPNLTHLELDWKYAPAQVVRQFMHMHMGLFFAACPKVTEFRYDGGFGLDDETTANEMAFSQQYAGFAKQLCHLEVCGAFESIRDILHYDYPNLKSLTLTVFDYGERKDFFQKLSLCTHDLERLRLGCPRQFSLQDLEIGFKTWGKTLQSLDIERPVFMDPDDHILGHLLPHLTRLEELGLNAWRTTFRLSDIQAIAQPDAPRLKVFRWFHADDIFKYDPLANAENVSKAIIDIFVAHSETLDTFIIEESFDFWKFGMDIFKHLHKAKNLENLRVQLNDIPTKEEIDGLLTACPKLGKSELGLMVVKEFFTECTLATMKYKEDTLELEAVDGSWGRTCHPMGTGIWS
ncbi:hypothetical protein FPRO03_10247 [Fusarium proliferatum]|nr:hypothetical protein FPRO03_10247 [Fusarium proliferatum]